MTVADAINRLQTNLTNSYSACEEKGATLPEKQNFDNLPATIGSITVGGSGEDLFKSIDENGTLTASNKETITLDGVKTIATYGLAYNWYNGSGLQNLNIPELTTVEERGLQYSLYGHKTLKNITFSGELDIGTYGMYYLAYNSSLENVNFDVIKTVGQYGLGYAFSGSKIKELIIHPKSKQAESKFNTTTYALYHICDSCSELERAVIGNYGRTLFSGYGLQFGFRNCPKLKFLRIGQINLNTSNGYGYGGQGNTISYLVQNCTGLEVLYIQGSGGGKSIGYLCDGCSNLIRVCLPLNQPSGANLAGQYMFRNCPKLKLVEFGYGRAFSDQTYYGLLKNAFFGTTSGVTMWSGDTGLINPNTTASNSPLYGCTGLEKVYLPLLVSASSGSGAANIFNNTGIKEIHFPKKYQTTIEADPNYATLWGRGAGNATVYFDLIKHIHLSNNRKYNLATTTTTPKGQETFPYSVNMNGIEYLRSEDDDTDLLFAWKNGNNFIYTCTLTPIETESVYGADYQNIGTVESSVVYYKWNENSNPYTNPPIYTTTPCYAEIGQDCYFMNEDGTFSLAGQVATVE